MNDLFIHQKIALQRYGDATEIPLFFDAGTGKLLVPETPVLTPQGFVPIKDIQVGDTIHGYDEWGHCVGKFHHEDVDLYDIEFSDHTTVRACGDHLWWVKDNRNTKKRRLNLWEVKSTSEILKEGLLYHGNSARWDIPVCQPIEFEHKDVPVAPYTLGVIIGDGHIGAHMVTVTSADQEVWDGILEEGYELGPVRQQKGNAAISYDIHKVASICPVSGRSWEKFIPDEYIFNDIDTRIKVLQGLIDTDGCVNMVHQRNGGQSAQLSYCTTSEQLFKDICLLVQTLGGIVTSVRKAEGQFEGKKYRMNWRFNIVLPRAIEKQCCTVKRKLDMLLIKEPKQKLHRKIISIKYVGKGEGYCLTTDTSDHTYLINDCIVTHNTLTALEIAMYKYRRGDIDAVLVIAPNGVHKQWATEEIPKWCKEVETTVQWRKNKKLFFVEGKLNIVCTNIEQFSTQTRYLEYVEWVNGHNTFIIVDEATRIKNPKAVRTQRLLYEFNTVVKRGRSIISSTPRTVARAILTGTPATNGPFDVWSMFEFLRPNYFGLNYYAFCNKYGLYYNIVVNGRSIRVLINETAWKAIKACETFEAANIVYGCSLSCYDYIKNQKQYEGPYRGIEQLRQEMCRIAMFVRIEDVQDMPERVYNRRLIEMSSEQMRIYREMEEHLISEYKGEVVSAKTKLTAYIRLQQIASGFISSEQLPQEEEEDPPPNKITWLDTTPKFDQLEVDLEEMLGIKGEECGEICDQQVIVVCHFSAEAERLFNFVTEKGYKACLMTGWKKVGSIEGFKEGKYQIMVANIRVISMGFNLQAHAHHMIFYSNTFSLEDRLQVEARIYRTGQQRTCFYTDYVMLNTIDMKVYAALKQKKVISDYIRDNSVEDMLEEYDELCQREYEDVVF